MKFRPCIDIHKGEVKQIVGSTLSEGDISGAPVENFVSSRSTAEFAAMYSEDR
jgi:phosphoribosylformimino-5-aminoimidazole carboxamide ribotide isomerase